MGISRIALSSIQTLNKNDSFLDGNPPYIPSSFESIATGTLSGFAATLSFTSIPQTYKSLQVRFQIIDSTGGSGFLYSFNGDTSTFYPTHELSGTYNYNASATASTSLHYIRTFARVKTVTTYPTVGIIDIIDYASTNKYKTTKSFAGSNDNNATSANAGVSLSSGLWQSTAAINQIDFSLNLGTATTGCIVALYGIKG
jgi:hypothetical protein